MDILSKMKSVISTPSAFFDGVKKEGSKPAFVYSIAITLINAVLTAALAYAINKVPITPSVVAVIAIGWVLTFLISFPIGAGIIHVFVSLIGGGKGGYNQTYKASVYSSTPSSLLGWIPWAGIAFNIYGLYLNIKGISKLHGISMKRAAAAILIPLIAIIVIAAVFAYAWFAGFLPTLPKA